MKKILVLLLALLLTCGCLAGCGGNGKSKDSSEDGVTELVLWSSYPEESLVVLRQVIERFNKEFPQYHLTVEYPGTVANIRMKLTTLRAEDYPSIFFGTPAAIGEYASAEFTAPIQPYLDADEEKWTDDIYENVKVVYSDLEGNMIGSPIGVSAKGYIVNTTALKAAGYSLEDITSFEKLAEAAKAAVSKGVIKYGYNINDGSDILDMLLYQGVDILDADNGFNGEVTKCLYGEGDTNAALKKLLTLQAELYGANAAYVNNSGAQGGASLFINGDLMFWSCTNSLLYEFDDIELGFDWAFIPHLGVDDNAKYKGYALTEGTGMFIANTGNETEMQGAYEFLKYMARTDNQVFWSTYRGYVPFTKAAAEHEDWIAFQKEVFPSSERLIEMMQNTPSDFRQPYGNLITPITSANKDMEGFIMSEPDGDIDSYIKDALDSINESIEILRLRGQ